MTLNELKMETKSCGRGMTSFIMIGSRKVGVTESHDDITHLICIRSVFWGVLLAVGT